MTRADKVQDGVLLAFAAGVPKGALIETDLDDLGHGADVVVVYGTRKHGVALAEKRWRAIQAQKERGRRVIIIESGYVRRDRYWSVGWDDINGYADFRLDPDMPGDRWAALGVALEPWIEPDRRKPVLFCGQRPHGSGAFHLDDYAAWEHETRRAIRAMGFKVKYRPHPGTAFSRPLDHELHDVSAVVTLNTTAGVEAVIAGVPTIALDRASMAWPVAGHDIEALRDPPTPERGAWACGLAYCQWTPDEMASGATWAHLTR